MLKENYYSVQEQIETSCKQAGRDIHSVTLLAVSKFHTASKVAELAKLGHRNFAESYIKEAKEKKKELETILDAELYSSLIWHSIGHIQTNKAKEVCVGYEFLHAVDSERLALALHTVLEKKEQKQKILLEINIANEEQKAGISLNECPKLIEKILKLPYLSIEGFMCLPPFQKKAGENRTYFKELYEVRNKMEETFHKSFPHLSMGTSSDYKEAILEGSTFIRVGTDIFGERMY